MGEISLNLLCCYTKGLFSRTIINYIKELFRGSKLKLTFYHLLEIPSNLLIPSCDYLKEIKRQEALERFIEHERENLFKEWEQITKELSEVMDLETEFIVELIQGEKVETALHYLRKKNYTAVLMGKRGLGKLASIYAGSFSHKMILYGNQPLWIIRNKRFNQKILVAFDLGEQGLKVIEYVLNILSFLKDYKVTFFHWVGFIGQSSIEGSLEDLLNQKLSPELNDFLIQVRIYFNEKPLLHKNITFKLTNFF